MSTFFDLVLLPAGFILSKCIENLCSRIIHTAVLFMVEKYCPCMSITKQLVKYTIVFKYSVPIKNNAFKNSYLLNNKFRRVSKSIQTLVNQLQML